MPEHNTQWVVSYDIYSVVKLCLLIFLEFRRVIPGIDVALLLRCVQLNLGCLDNVEIGMLQRLPRDKREHLL